MNKYLMLSAAAALVGTAGSANAGSLINTFQFGTAGGGSYCDGGAAFTSGGGLRSWIHTNNNCGGATSQGQGLVGKLSEVGFKGADMSDMLFCKNYGFSACNTYVNFQLSKKINNGNPWTLTIGFGGTTSFVANSGVYINVGHAGKAKGGSKSATSNLKQLIQVHRSSKG